MSVFGVVRGSGGGTRALRVSSSWRMGLVALVVLALALVSAGATWGATSAYDPAADANSMYNTTLYNGAQAWWNAGYTGAGVDVALIDTGVTSGGRPGRPGQDRLRAGSLARITGAEPAQPRHQWARHLHGRPDRRPRPGPDRSSAAHRPRPTGAWRRTPGSSSVKVGVADGGVDVSQVIAAIDWVVQHRNDDGLNIRVINLSYGTNSTQDYTVDPLAYAAEQAWRKGIVVVAAGGNYGFQSHMNNAPALANPALRSLSHRGGRRRLDGDCDPRGRHDSGLLALAEARSHAKCRPGSPGNPHAGPASSELVHRHRVS